MEERSHEARFARKSAPPPPQLLCDSARSLTFSSLLRLRRTEKSDVTRLSAQSFPIEPDFRLCFPVRAQQDTKARTHAKPHRQVKSGAAPLEIAPHDARGARHDGAESDSSWVQHIQGHGSLTGPPESHARAARNAFERSSSERRGTPSRSRRRNARTRTISASPCGLRWASTSPESFACSSALSSRLRASLLSRARGGFDTSPVFTRASLARGESAPRARSAPRASLARPRARRPARRRTPGRSARV